MKKTLIVLFTLSCLVAQAQKNNIKLNLPALAFKNVSMQYERALSTNKSVALGASALIPTVKKLPGFDDLASLTLTGFALTPEFRFYLGKKDAPRGFYLAPYARYAKYTLKGEIDFSDPQTDVTVQTELKGKWSHINGGLMMGAQWLINDKISIDWWILGLHGGSGKIAFEIPYDMSGYSDEEIEEVESSVQAAFGVAGINVRAKDDQTVEAWFKLPNFGARAGLCVGYAF